MDSGRALQRRVVRWGLLGTMTFSLTAGIGGAAAAGSQAGASTALSVHAESTSRGRAAVVVMVRFRAGVKQLKVAPRSHADAYDRDADFGEWIEQGQGCDTRAVVLKAVSRVPTTQTGECTIKTGQWLSYYDGHTYTSASDLQIDHLVPVANVWVSGAWRWSQTRRVAYYNDLDDQRTLAAVDAHDNESKGDRSPDEWLPPVHRPVRRPEPVRVLDRDRTTGRLIGRADPTPALHEIRDNLGA